MFAIAGVKPPAANVRSRNCDGFDPAREARQLPRYRVLVHDAFAGSALHFRLCGLQSGNRLGLVAAGNSRLHLADERPHTRLPRMVTRGTLSGLTNALARGCSVGHGLAGLLDERRQGRRQSAVEGAEL